MATAEFEELKLSVILVDDASAGLAALRAEMRNFNTDSIRFLTNARGNAQAYKQLGRETEEVVKGLRAAGTAFSRAAGVVGIAVGIYYKVITTLSEFALEVEQVANAAQLAGVSYADLRNVSEQLARKGLSPESAGRVLGALNNLGLQLQSLEGIREFQNSILNSKIVLDPVQEQAYIQAMIEARGWQERNAIVQNALRNIEKKGIEQNLSETQIRINQKEFLIKNNLPEELLLSGDLNATTEEQSKKYKQLQESAKLWTDIIHKIVQNVNTIIAIFNADSMAADGPFYWMLTQAVDVTGWIDDNLNSWLETLSDAGAELAKVFGGSPEGKGEEKKGEGLGDFMMPPVEPMGGDDLPLKLEKLIKAFREFNENLRTGVPASTQQDRYASLGSMATPGLQLAPAAQAGDVYTDKYPIWPGGGAKPAGSDVGPGSGIGAGGGTGVGASPMRGFGDSSFGQGPVEGSFRRGVPRLRTPGGLPLGRRWGPGAADGNDLPGGRMPEPIPGDFRMPGGSGPLDPRRSNNLGVAQPDYLEGTKPSTNIQDVRTGSWGGPGGAGGTSQPPHLMPGYSSREKSVFVPGLDLTAPHYPPSTSTNPHDLTLADFQSEQFYIREQRQKFAEGSMRDLIAKNPSLYRRGAEKTGQLIELRQEREAAELNEPRAFPWRAPPGPRRPPGEIPPSGIPTDRGAFALDRSVLDQGMGNEMSGRLEGGAKLNVNYNGPPAQVTAETSGILSGSQVDRQFPLEE